MPLYPLTNQEAQFFQPGPSAEIRHHSTLFDRGWRIASIRIPVTLSEPHQKLQDEEHNDKMDFRSSDSEVEEVPH
ncbi:hypothetical protein TNCT_212001 [Trichonephila clavata]|uniref:Uncharacterized protein n=1 Tax=Trichonephila clavata TaxID=2740835 RepID=A0A8X6L1H5_TRICU|nr:hypothetical protein TNCT_212001 [Trichonephila clavata]